MIYMTLFMFSEVEKSALCYTAASSWNNLQHSLKIHILFVVWTERCFYLFLLSMYYFNCMFCFVFLYSYVCYFSVYSNF